MKGPRAGLTRADVGDLISRLDGEIDCSTDARRRNPLQAHDRFGRNATTKPVTEEIRCFGARSRSVAGSALQARRGSMPASRPS